MIEASPGASHVSPEVASAMTEFKAGEDNPAVAYVSKMVSIPESELPENKRKAGGSLTAEEARELAKRKRAEFAKAQALSSDGDSVSVLIDTFEETNLNDQQPKEDPEHLIGFARLYSGTLKVGQEVYVLPPKFSPADAHAHPEPKKVKITGLYILMGRGLEPLDSVPAGCVFGVAGLEGHILKNGTICTQLEGAVNLAGVTMATQPIVRVALEPVNPGDLDKMIRGLKMLEQSDPCALYEVLESGEHVVLTAGELHLERCLKDLRERFAKCEIQAGEPIVPYRESIVAATEMNPPKNKDLPRGTVEGLTSSKQISVRLRVRPLPAAVTEFLMNHAGEIKNLYSESRAAEDSKRVADSHTDESHDESAEHAVIEEKGIVETGKKLSLDEFRKRLTEAFAEAKAEKEIWNGVVDKIAAFGPRRVGPNVLVDITSSGTCGKM